VPDPVDELRRRRDEVRAEMGGAERIERLHERGERTIREHIDGLLDAGSFEEVGTFAHSARPEDAAATPGDGKIGGHGLVDGHPVTVAGDDLTVKRGSSSQIGGRRLHKLYGHAIRAGHPMVYFGATGGARLPDSMGSAGFATVSPGTAMFARQRRVPFATVIVGNSFGGSSFFSAASDLVVQVRGTCLAVTSPRVVEVATGEKIEMEELGGAEVHERKTGQIDLAVDTPEEAYAAVRRWLSYLPPNAWTRAPRTIAGELGPDAGIAELVPERRSRAYDMKRVLERVLDDGSPMELAPGFGRGLIAALGRLNGHSVGVLASQPKFYAGALDPAACEKAVRLLCLCDAFDLPLVLLQDVPGFFVGREVEHAGMLKHAIRLQTALTLSQAPKLTVVMRKAYGMAYFSLGGNDTGVDAVYAWPGAEISFMDPEVGANVVGAPVEAMFADTDPYGAAGSMAVDEVIDPADTRSTLARALDRFEARPAVEGWRRPLASWPTC
jgi:acetyl-CoA carboxylase carboxyltransferase component